MNTITSTEYKAVLENTFTPGKPVTKAGWVRSATAQTLEAVRLASEMFLNQFAQETAEGREQHPQDYAGALRSIYNRIGDDITRIETNLKKGE